MSVEVRAVVGIDQLERWVAIHNEVRPDDPQTTGAKALVRAEAKRDYHNVVREAEASLPLVHPAVTFR